MAEGRQSARNVLTAGAAAFIGLWFAWLAGIDGRTIAGVPVLFACALLAFALNWLAWIPAARARTEKYYDLTGAITYLSVIALAVTLSAPLDLRGGVVAAMVCIWALRLGLFLFARVHQAGSDRRFDAIKRDPARFLVVWIMQGLWVVMTAGAALATIAAPERVGVDGWLVAGALLWLAGFTIEVVADAQKRTFRRDPANRDRYIAHGLWAWSRHPNYFGEIVLWTGIALIAVPIVQVWSALVLVSPLFVWLLLTRISGIPLLDAQGKARWGDDPAWQARQRQVPALLPRRPSR